MVTFLGGQPSLQLPGDQLASRPKRATSNVILKFNVKQIASQPGWPKTHAAKGRERCFRCRASGAGSVAVMVEPAGKNAQRLYAGVDISAPVDVIWGALTDYDGLGTFIPGLAENRCLERRAQGAQLLQIGEQEIAFGAKFRARVVLDIQEFWSGVPGPNGNGAARSNGGRDEARIEPRSPLPTQPHDIAFCACEGDFQVFRGVWRIQEGPRGVESSRLSYALFVRPQVWLPVRLVQGRIENEIKNNLAAVRRHTEGLYSRQRAGLAA